MGGGRRAEGGQQARPGSHEAGRPQHGHWPCLTPEVITSLEPTSGHRGRAESCPFTRDHRRVFVLRSPAQLVTVSRLAPPPRV